MFTHAQQFGLTYEYFVVLSECPGTSPGDKTYNNEPAIAPWLSSLPANTVVFVDQVYHMAARLQFPSASLAFIGTVASECGFRTVDQRSVPVTLTNGSTYAQTTAGSQGDIGQAVSGAGIPPGTKVINNTVLLGVTNWILSQAATMGGAQNVTTAYNDYYLCANFGAGMGTVSTGLGTPTVGSDYQTPVSMTAQFSGASTLLLQTQWIGVTVFPQLVQASCLVPGTFVVLNGMTKALSLPATAAATAASVTVGDYYPGALVGVSDAGPVSLSGPCFFYAPSIDAAGVTQIQLRNLIFDLGENTQAPDGTPITALGLVHPQAGTHIESIEINAQSGTSLTAYGLTIFSNGTGKAGGGYKICEIVQYGNGLFKSMLYADGSNGGTLAGAVADVSFEQYTTGPAGVTTSIGYGGSPIVVNQVNGGYLYGHHEGMPTGSTDVAMIRVVDSMNLRILTNFELGDEKDLDRPAIRITSTSDLPLPGWGIGLRSSTQGLTVGQTWVAVEPDLGGSVVRAAGGLFSGSYWYEFQPLGTGTEGIPAAGSFMLLAGSANPQPMMMPTFNGISKEWIDQAGGLHPSSGYAAFDSNNSWTVPSGVTQIRARVTGAGGGGGGGGTVVANTTQAGGGGGGAGLVVDQYFSVTVGQLVTITSGPHGTRGAAGGIGVSNVTASGGQGGTGGTSMIGSTLPSGNSFLLEAPGGEGGFGSTAPSLIGGTGGSYGGDYLLPGYAGYGGTGGFNSAVPFLTVVGGGGGGNGLVSDSGGGGGGAQSSTTGLQIQSSGTAAGGNPGGAGGYGIDATEPGCGGGGGGGGLRNNVPHPGGTGGLGGPGLVEIWWTT